MMGGAAPHAPRDLAQFSSRVDGSALAVLSDCRTMERLDRRIGQRRDATRAPTQARSGWRPSGRLLISPLHHLRTAEILSKRWGPPQVFNLGGPVIAVLESDHLGWRTVRFSKVEEVRNLYASAYPDLTTAAIEGPEVVGNKLVYRLTRAIGTKG